MASQPISPTTSTPHQSLSPPLVCFTNCLLTIHGELIPQDLYFSPTTGLITPNYYFKTENVERIDLEGRIVAPGFLEVQINGVGGVHFSNLCSDPKGEESLSKVARLELEAGVTGWWATIPTVPLERWKQILPLLKPRTFPGVGADLLGAHVEGPYLAPSKKGAHDSSLFALPTETTPETIYGTSNLEESIKMITLAPELPGSIAMIGQLVEEFPGIVIAMGHSEATYSDGVAATSMGARMITHTFNAMNALNHREPGLPGLMSTGKCWFSVIPDGIHVHPSVLTLVLRADPSRCILVTDSIELAGLPDGVYKGHGQIKGMQRKEGNRVTLVEQSETHEQSESHKRSEGPKKGGTLVGSCIRLDQCVRNMVRWSNCGIAEAVRCVTENVAEMSGERKRGVLEAGRRADFVVLSTGGDVEETWIQGRRVWRKEGD